MAALSSSRISARRRMASLSWSSYWTWAFLPRDIAGHHGAQSSSHGSCCCRGAAAAGCSGGRGQLLDKRLDARPKAAYSQLSRSSRRPAGSPRISEESKFSILQEPFGRVLQGLFRNQADDLAREGHNAISCGFALDVFVHARDWCLVGICQIHRDLRQDRGRRRPCLLRSAARRWRSARPCRSSSRFRRREC